MTWSKMTDRPTLYLAHIVWEGECRVIEVIEFTIVRETPRRWYLDRQPQPGTFGIRRYVDKSHAVCLYAASTDRSAAVAAFCRYERIWAARQLKCAQVTLAACDEAEARLAHGGS